MSECPPKSDARLALQVAFYALDEEIQRSRGEVEWELERRFQDFLVKINVERKPDSNPLQENLLNCSDFTKKES